MAIKHVTSVRGDLADLVVDKIDVGAGSEGSLDLHAGSRDTPGSLLCSIPFNDPAFGAASSGTATMVTSPTVEGQATGSGTAGMFYIRDKGDNGILRGTVGLTGSGEDLEMSNNTLAVNDYVRITSLTYTASE
jgi:hypothetical protein